MGVGLGNQITSLLGGFYLSFPSHGLNTIKIIHLILLFSSIAVFYVKFYVEQIIVAAVIAFYIMVVKTVAYALNKLFDSQNSQTIIEKDQKSESPLKPNEIILPPGIPLQLWEARHVLFTQEINTAAADLILSGFDPDQVFALVALINNGTVTPKTRLAKNEEEAHETLVTCCGKYYLLYFTREMLNKVVDRPQSILEIIICGLLAGVTVFAAGNVTDDPSLNVINCFSLVLSLFSLTLAPSTDNYSTTINDPYIKYTRCFTTCIFAGAQRLLYLVGIKYNIFLYMIFLLPILIYIGVVGHPILIIHWFFELANLYLCGICGSPTLVISILDFVLNCASYGIIYAIFKFIDNIKIRVLVLLIFISVVSQISFSNVIPNLRVFIKAILYIVFATCATAITVFAGNIPHIFLFVPCILCVTDLLLYYATSYSQYIVFHGKLFNIDNIYVFDSISLIRIFFISMYISKTYLDYESKYYTLLAGLCLFRISLSSPYIGFFITFVTSFLLNYDFQMENRLTSLFVGCLITIKMINIYRIIKSRFKFNSMGMLEEEFPQIITDLIIVLIIEYYPDIRSSFNTPFLAWSLLIGEPPKISNPFYIFSPPKPFSFFQSITRNRYNSFQSNDTSHNVELPVYVTLSDDLKRKINYYIQIGKFGLVFPDSFYMLMLDDMICIVHIISIGAHQCYFECRFLEYQSQTICHLGESSILEKVCIEEKRFGNTIHSLSFRFYAYEYIASDIKLNSLSMSKIQAENITAIPKEQMRYWCSIAALYIAIHIDEHCDPKKLLSSLNVDENHKDSTGDNTVQISTESQTHSDMIDEKTQTLHENYEYSESVNTLASEKCQISTKDILDHLYQYFQPMMSLYGTNTNVDKLTAKFCDKYNNSNPDQIKQIATYLSLYILDSTESENADVSKELTKFFNGNYSYTNSEIKSLIIATAQLFVVLLLMNSVGIAPDFPENEDDVNDDFYEELFEFIDECVETKTFSIDAKNIAQKLVHSEQPALLMQEDAEKAVILRYGTAEQKWNVFRLETGIIRGLWSTEASTILFDATVLSERSSIQFNGVLLRNITNQSCNPPIGYPVLVTNILPSII